MRRCLLGAFVLSVAVTGLAVPSASGVQVEQSTIVSDNPVDWTPHALDGEVHALVQVGNTIVVGGNFTTVRSATSTTQLTRRNIFAYDATTGAISTTFIPALNGEVDSLLPATDGTSVYVGGRFSTVNGASRRYLARLSVGNGSTISTFTAFLTNRVTDLKLSGGRLYVGGLFTSSGGQPRTLLTTLNPTTGALDDFMDVNFSAPVRGGALQVDKFDITPDGSKLVALGNFSQVDGQSRTQIVMLDLTGPAAAVSSWATTRFSNDCSPQFLTWVHDVDISPDGQFFVVVTTGGGWGQNFLCDSSSRWETNATGPGQQPTWIDQTGGDTLWSVAITGVAVYVGGHQRWLNNPEGHNAPAFGAVSRQGLAALDPLNGLPYSWDPQRDRGVGVFDLTSTRDGLLMGSDTDRVGHYEYHGRLALFPNSSLVPPPGFTGTLPGNVVNLGTTTTRRSFDGSSAGSASTIGTGGVDFGSARGGVMIDGILYTGWSDGTFYQRPFNGTTFGAATAINVNGITAFTTDLRTASGMFFQQGRLYYTVAGSSNLYYRYFTPESGIVGALRFTASGNVTGVDFSRVSGMFLNGSSLYWATSNDGNLHRVTFTNGRPVSGTASIVSGPGIDGVDWRSRGLFINANAAPAPNKPPTASWSSSCDLLQCNFNGGGSTDVDGAIVSYAWNFGDGGSASTAVALHTFAAGSYQVSLTVTDDDGDTDTLTRSVTATDQVAPITFIGAASSNRNAASHSVTVPAGVAPGDGLLLTMTYNTAAPTVSDPVGVTGWTLLRTLSSGTVVTRVWAKAAAPGDAGSTVTVNLSDLAKAGLTIAAYGGTDTANPIAGFASAAETTSRTGHRTPTLTSSTPGAWRVSYWGEKSSTTTGWTSVPGGEVNRNVTTGSGGGHITTLLTDSGGPVATGTQGGLNATTDVASSTATMWTFLLAPR